MKDCRADPKSAVFRLAVNVTQTEQDIVVYTEMVPKAQNITPDFIVNVTFDRVIDIKQVKFALDLDNEDDELPKEGLANTLLNISEIFVTDKMLKLRDIDSAIVHVNTSFLLVKLNETQMNSLVKNYTQN